MFPVNAERVPQRVEHGIGIARFSSQLSPDPLLQTPTLVVLHTALVSLRIISK